MSVPHPIPYQGSKRALAKWILQYFPLDAGRLIEPFAGSAAVSLAALAGGKVRQVLISDADDALITLWQRISDAPDALAEAYTRIWHEQSGRERAYYDQVRAEFNQTHNPDLFLFLLARCVKAAVRYNGNGEFNQSPDNRRKGTLPQTMRQSIVAASRLLSGKASIRHADYRQVLTEAAPDDIVYLDPPYQGVCKNRDPRYKAQVTFDQFVETLNSLNERRIAYIVSYDGRTEKKTYGEFLPSFLDLMRIEIDAGRSSQATLLGRKATTFESLYLSAALISRLETQAPLQVNTRLGQTRLVETPVLSIMR